MRNLTATILAGTADLTTITGSSLDTNQAINITFQTAVTGGVIAAGTVKIQGNNSPPLRGDTKLGPTSSTWSDIPNATATMTAGVVPMIVLSNTACQFMRAVFTRSAGVVSETITVQANSIGA